VWQAGPGTASWIVRNRNRRAGRRRPAPSGWQVSGFHGRAGDEVDRIGVIYNPV
jgi:hypothetical protein